MNGERLETTLEQPFYVEGNDCIPAGNLQGGDRVRQADGTVGMV
jgi:hypothetical protein